jgi:hypothetical protein
MQNVSEILLYSLLVVFFALGIIYGRRALRIVFWPVRLVLRGFIKVFGWIGRLFAPVRRIVRKLPSAATKGASTTVRVREQPWQMLLHILDSKSRSDIALGEVPLDIRSRTQRRGWLFHWIDPNRTLELLKETIKFDDASGDLDLANHFYKREVDHDVSPSGLYEDSEGAFIIDTFKGSDQALFYVLRKMQTTITRNVEKYIALVSAILFLSMFSIVTFLFGYFGNPSNFSGGWQRAATGFADVWLLAPLVALFFGAPFLRYVYWNSERNNGQKLNYYVQTYLNRIRQQYQTTLTALSQGVQDMAYDETEIGKRSRVWYVDFQWLALRTFFLELYVRNFIFHVRRNALWLSMFLPAALLGALAIFYLLFRPGIPNGVTLLGHTLTVAHASLHLDAMVAITMVAVLLGYFVFLGQLLSVFRGEIVRETWPRFSGMDLMAHMQEIVEDDKREIVGWRRRFGARGGPTGV